MIQQELQSIEVGDTVLLGSQRIRARVKHYNPNIGGSVRVQIDGIDGLNHGLYWFSVSDVVEVIKPPNPMPEFQEGDRVLRRDSPFKSLFERLRPGTPALDESVWDELWRLTAPNTLTKIWERR